MGDRGNVYIKQHCSGNDNVGIYLYTHWSGSDLPLTVHNALVRGKDRWCDEPYLARIIFSEMIKNDPILETTGFGITTYLTDNEYMIVYIDCEKDIVGYVKPGEEKKESPNFIKKWTFKEFCEKKDFGDLPSKW